MITSEKIEQLYTDACTADLGGTPRKRWSVVLADLVNAHERLEAEAGDTVFDDERPAPRRELARRTFLFVTGDEVDVDRIVAIDANAPNSIAHISLTHGTFVRVRFGSDAERSQQLEAMRAFRGGQ